MTQLAFEGGANKSASRSVDLAHLVRRTQTTIYKIETGQLKNISEDLAIAIAARLDADWEDLFVAHEESAAPRASIGSADTIGVPA